VLVLFPRGIRACPNLKYTGVETCPFTHQAYIALTCNKGGRFRARYVLKAHAAELIQKLNSSLSAVRGTLLCLAGTSAAENPEPAPTSRLACGTGLLGIWMGALI